MEVHFRENIRDRLRKIVENKKTEGVNHTVHSALTKLGETYTIGKINDMARVGKEVTYIKLMELLEDIIKLDKPELKVIGLPNNEINVEYKLSEGLNKEGELEILVTESQIPLTADIVSSSHINILNKSISIDKIRIKYAVNIDQGLDLGNSTEHITIITKYKTINVKFFIKCNIGWEFSWEHPFKNVQQFYDFYCDDGSTALDIFIQDEFKKWLFKNELHDIITVYDNTMNNNSEAWIRNFFYALDYISLTEKVNTGGNLSDTNKNEIPRMKVENYQMEMGMLSGRKIHKLNAQPTGYARDNDFVNIRLGEDKVVIIRKLSTFSSIANKLTRRVVTSNVLIKCPEKLINISIALK